MSQEYPLNYIQFIKNDFTPWSFTLDVLRFVSTDEVFSDETLSGRFLKTFGCRQDMDTYCGFEIINNVVQENVIVFHPSFQGKSESWEIIETEYADFNEFFKADLNEEEFDTIGGILVQQFGHVPLRDEELYFNNFHFRIVKSDGRRIKTIQVSKPTPNTPE